MPRTISIIIPARNEEKNLPKCLERITQAFNYLLSKDSKERNWNLEIVVVINRCSDRTEEIARNHGCLVIHEDAKNLAAIRNSGVRASSGELTITIDADSFMSKSMLHEAILHLQNPKIIGGGVLILPDRWSLGLLVTGLLLLPLILRDRISCGMFFVRRADFDAIGGFNEAWITVEDVEFARRLRAYGIKKGMRYATIWRAWITTSMRKLDAFGNWYFVKNPRMLWKIFQGRDQEIGNKVWYDFDKR